MGDDRTRGSVRLDGSVGMAGRCAHALRNAALVLLVVALTGCGGSKVAAGKLPSSSASTRARSEVIELQALERPVVRELKLAFIDLSAGRDMRAASRLEHASDRGERLVDWVEAHHDFAEANGASVECVNESVRELHEQVERIGERLGEHRASAGDHRELRIRLGEVVNCIDSGD